MDSTYFPIDGSSSHALTRVKEAHGSAGVTLTVGVVGVLCSISDDSVIKDSARVVRESNEDLFSPDVATVELSVMDGSGSDGGGWSANFLVGLGCWDSHGKIGRGFSAGGAGFSFGTSYHIFRGGLGYRWGGMKGAGSEDIS